jgi:Colicin V production protein.
MSVQTLNLILAACVVLFLVNGFFQGLIHMLGSFLGLIIGVGVASRWDTAGGAWLHAQTGWNENICVIVAFVIILIVFTRVFGIILHVLEKAFNFMKIPLVGLANRVAGGILGFFEGVFVVGATLIIVKTLPFPIVNTLSDSVLATSLMAAASLLLPLLPKSIQELYKV